MNTIKEIFVTYAPEYIEKYGDTIPEQHQKVIDAIINCRTAAYGTVIYECTECGKTHETFRSCGNRHCPVCQNHKTRQWLEKQLERQVPGHHFMITVTVPESLRPFMRSNQQLSYSALFKSSADAIKLLAKDETYIGGDIPGFFGALHTWGEQLIYHPHIHFIVPGGAFSTVDAQWHPSRIDFFVPVKALSPIIRAKFKAEMIKADKLEEIPSQVWETDWNINCKAVGNAEYSIRYLAPYVFKVAISDSRIVSVNDRIVTFRCKKEKSNRLRTVSLDVMEFIRRYLTHVLPSGFMKIRYYGFMNSNCSVSVKEISDLIELANGFELESPKVKLEPLKPLYCPVCGGKMKYVASVLPYMLPRIRDRGLTTIS